MKKNVSAIILNIFGAIIMMVAVVFSVNYYGSVFTAMAGELAVISASSTIGATSSGYNYIESSLFLESSENIIVPDLEEAPEDEEYVFVSLLSETPDMPESTGTIISETYSYTTNGTTILQLASGLLRNYTSVSTEEIMDITSQSPPIVLTDTDEPQVLIMHTHTTESYQIYDATWYDMSISDRSTDYDINVAFVGEIIAQEIESYGITVIHDITLNDYPSYSGSYDRSAEVVKAYLEEYPSIQIVLDIHRDGIIVDDTTKVKPVVSIDGQDAAQVMIISGCDDVDYDYPNWAENLKFANLIQTTIESDNPGLTRPILFDYRFYNQDLTTGSILIEVGSQSNNLDEVAYSAHLIGESIGKALTTLIQ